MTGTSGIAVLVVEPFAKSVLTARRFVGMGAWPAGMTLVGVANKVESAEDQSYLETELERLGVPLWATVPLDSAVKAAERNAQPLITIDPGTPAKRAVATLADRLEDAARAREALPTTSSS